MSTTAIDAPRESERSLVRLLQGLASSRDRLRQPLGGRATGLVIAVLLEALLLLALLTLGREPPLGAPKADTLTVIQLSDAQPAASLAPRHAQEEAQRPDAPQPQPPPPEVHKTEVEPAVTIPLIQVSPQPMAESDISKPPSPPAPARRKSTYGPPSPGPSSDDSERVPGSGPNGEPLYAARWYREPYDDELRGYLSTAQGPGWGLIACKTVADFRVDDCIGLGEYPQGSHIMRSVLAAAWQFRVRPPRLGGQSQVGSWVRIRIDYTSNRD
jgi:protein TonB